MKFGQWFVLPKLECKPLIVRKSNDMSIRVLGGQYNAYRKRFLALLLIHICLVIVNYAMHTPAGKTHRTEGKGDFFKSGLHKS